MKYRGKAGIRFPCISTPDGKQECWGIELQFWTGDSMGLTSEGDVAFREKVSIANWHIEQVEIRVAKTTLEM